MSVAELRSRFSTHQSANFGATRRSPQVRRLPLRGGTAAMC